MTDLNHVSPRGSKQSQLAPAVDGIQSVAAGVFLPSGEDLRRQAIGIGFRSKRLARNAVQFLRDHQLPLSCPHGASKRG